MSQTENMCFTAVPDPPAADRHTLVLIHGAGLSRKLWNGQMAGLSEVANVVALDLPGHGDSPGAGYASIADYARDVLRVIKKAEFPRPVLCGLSMGGAIVQYLLIHYPEQFVAGILLNTGAKLRVLPLIFETLYAPRKEFIDLLLAAAVSENNRNEELRSLVAASADCEPEVAEKDFTACDAFDVMGQLAEIAVPVQILSGADDLTTPPKYAAYLADNIPQAELVTIKDAGHLAPLEQPAAVNEAIAAFLKRLP